MQCSESLWKTSKAKLGKIFPDLGGKNFERDFVDIDLHALWGSCLCCFNPIWLPFLGESAPLGKLKIEMD